MNVNIIMIMTNGKLFLKLKDHSQQMLFNHVHLFDHRLLYIYIGYIRGALVEWLYPAMLLS